MFFDRPVNCEVDKFSLVHLDEMPWAGTVTPGFLQKVVESVENSGARRESGMLKLRAGAGPLAIQTDFRLDLFVVQGVLNDGTRAWSEGVYVRLPPQTKVSLSSEVGCELLYRARMTADRETSLLIKDSTQEKNWEPWGSRGSMMVNFSQQGASADRCWLGRSVPNLQVPDHDHFGGEEVFMIRGSMADSACVLGQGTWARIPEGMRHAPIVGAEGCTMLVWEGDVAL